MNYSDYDYETPETEPPPWSPASSTFQGQTYTTPRNTQMVSAPPNVVVNAAPQPAVPELVYQSPVAPAAQGPMVDNSSLVMLGSLIQSVQQTQKEQRYILRDFDARLARIENTITPPPPTQVPSFERTTWWAIWGLLMLILGGALTVLILLILMRVSFR